MALAKQLSFYCNGIDLAANAIKSFDASGEAEELDTTTLGDSMKSFITGYTNGTLSAEGIWAFDSTDLDEIHNIFTTAFISGAEAVITATLAPAAVGVDTIMMNAVETSYGINNELGALIMVTADFRATTGMAIGKWLFNAAVDTTTTNGTGVGKGATTSNGGLFQVHWQNGAGTEDITAKIQHSPDNATWADLGTITKTNVTGFGADSLEIAPGTTVDEYIRARIAVAQGAVNVQAAFARR